MPKQTFDISPESSTLLREYHDRRKQNGEHITLNEIVTEAIKSYCLIEQRGRAEEIFEKTMERRFQKYENRLASMIAAVGVDVAMILSETLETVAAYEENQGKSYQNIYQDLRKEGVALFNRHRAFKLDPSK
ncbi:hypothetical protein [Alicyclobacillus fodiniaquatilis]|uniref:Uncharacterized protein n=1 Tax=Alicyclobacillus fodiniaquatilis TaxID=1661150 RepID=A0ABW4JCU4_9BACL